MSTVRADDPALLVRGRTFVVTWPDGQNRSATIRRRPSESVRRVRDTGMATAALPGTFAWLLLTV